MTTGILHDQTLEKQIEKQMGCMAGFFQLFDRHQILTGKRLYTTKRLPSPPPPPPPPAADNFTAESEKTVKSSETELRSPSPEAKSPLPLPILELKEGARSPWKFCKEAPRLSLDSRATTDSKGSLYAREIRQNATVSQSNRTPSVIARLMGLESLQNSNPEPAKNSELRRSASESRVSRDLFQSRLIDSNNFQLNQSQSNNNNNVIRDNAAAKVKTTTVTTDPTKFSTRNAKVDKQMLSRRKSFFDSEDFFPEPKQSASMYGEIERRLRMRGIDEPTKDLETLKQILEALQLKGLLHSNKQSGQIRHRNFVYERHESPIVIMKPSRPPVSRVRRSQNAGEDFPSASPRRERPQIERNVRNQGRAANSMSPTRRESNVKSSSTSSSSNSPLKRRPLKGNESTEQRRGSPIQSPMRSPKRTGSDQAVTNRSQSYRKPTAEIHPKEKIAMVVEEESSSVSESSVSTSSQTDNERVKMEEYKEGRSLLERCGKLLHSIAEMTATELQPSPVSVLDSSFYKDETSSSSPSPVLKRSIDFKDQLGEFEEEIWSPAISPIQSNREDQSDDCDFIYISEILRASNYLPEDSDIFLLLEKQQYLKGNDTSEVSTLQRKLIFDTISEILDRNKQLPPWKPSYSSNYSLAKPSLKRVWSEFQRIRERDTAEEDLFSIIRGLLRKDLAGDAIHGWGDCLVETSEAVLDIERLIFKDIVGETIRDLASNFAGKCRVTEPRRKLVF